MKISFLYLTFYFMVCQYARKTVQAFVDPDAYKNVTELITTKGYPCEEHTVVTKDGYILSMQRIPYGKNNNTERGNKKVVLLIHGELGDPKTWFLNPPGQGLGYVLADEGCDVWIIGDRGCTYSKKHVKYPVRSYQFWDWSFDEIAQYDATATIDYVLNATGKEALYVIGYSRGNTVGFALLSAFPEYNQKVKLLVALAPIAYVGHFRIPVKYVIPFRNAIAASINAVTQGEFLPTNKFTRKVIAKFCAVQDLELCQTFIFALAGQDRKNLNMTRVPIYSAQYPSSTSTRILVHFGQLYESKKFRKFDFGLLGNKKKYGRFTPPDYPLSRITSPVALFWSENDKIADTIDVNILKKELTSVKALHDFPDPAKEYNHFDFIWAKDSQERIYKPLLDLLSQY